MQTSKLSDWQNPFVDVFKRYSTFETLEQAMKGNVTVIHVMAVMKEPAIARKCIKLAGTVPSNSTVTVPTPNGEIKHCDLTGRYLYFELFVLPEKFFTIHVDIAVKDREPGVRLTLTNMDKEYSVSGGNVLKVPFQTDRSVWTIACLDIEHHLENYGLLPKGAVKSFKDCHIIKGFQVCANIVVRGLYTSPNVYDWDSLPKEMSFKLVKGGRWSDQYNFIYLPATIEPVEVKKRMRKAEREQENEPNNHEEEVSMGGPPKPQPAGEGKSQGPGNSKGAISFIQPNFTGQTQQDIQEMPSEPVVEINYALSFSPIHNPDILYQDNTIYYSSGSLVVAKSLATGEQQFLQGHTDYISAMDSVDNWIITVQKGPKAIVRVWVDHKCIYTFQAPQEKVQQLRANRKKHIAIVAIDVYNRQVISIFDLSEVESKKRAKLIARQVSDFNILTLKWSPVEHDKLVSCGRENIRFWRTKSEHLPGTPVILKHHARNSIFTVLDFEYAYDNPNPAVQQEKIKNVYVGSQNGLLYQVNYHTHELEEVYKLHESAICSIVMSVGFCVTGGEDQVLRVWPLDFSEYILEAEHEGIITSLSLAEDGMHVACGTNSGGLGILDLTNHNYKTILRSHTDNVLQIVQHEYSGSVITLSADLTIRLWDPERLEQTYQFLYPKEDPCTSISGNPLSMYFAAGFKSGMLRIFDIEKTCISEELPKHQEPIEFLLYSPDGKFLAVLEKKLAMLYSPLHSHQAVKHLPVEMPSKYQSCSFSPDSTVLAIIGDSGTHINIWELKTLQLTGKLFTGRVVRKVKFSPEGCLWAIFEDASIRRYNLTNMTVEAEIQALHRGALTDCDFDIHNYLLFTVGEDSLLKVWDYSFQREPHQVNIGHVGAINGVLARDGKVWTIGSEGILQWNLRKDIPAYDPPFIKARAANFIKSNVKEERPLPFSMISGEVDKSIQPLVSPAHGEEQLNLSQNVVVPRVHEGPILFSQRLKKKDNDQLMVVGEPKFTPQRVDMLFLQKVQDFKKSKKRDHKPRIISEILPLNIKYGLPAKHFFREELEPSQKEYLQKIELIKQNPGQFKIKYLMGLEAHSHDHLVWNYVFGWYAYVLDNLIVVEQLGKERSQKIIPMPEKIGQLILTSDMKRLICCSAFNSIKKPKGAADGSSEQDSQMSADSSGSADQAQAAFANIYVMTREFEVDKKLSFHPRGIQSMCLSENGKYLISVGNFRECTVCVWEMATGKLKASSYTLDKLNDVKAMDWASEGRNLEFATVGRDQVHFWALDRDDKLEYYDVFIPKSENGDIPEITACEYIYVGESPKLLLGLTNGYIMAVEYGTFKVVLSRLLTSGPIIGIRNVSKKIIVNSADGNIYFWSYESVLKDISLPNFSKLNLQFSVNAIAMDPEGQEGLVATSEGIFYTNLKEQYSSLLVGGFSSPPRFTKILNQQFFITSHDNGRLKLWNLETGEELRTYKWKSACKEAYFDETLNKLICFLENNNQIKLVNLNKFTRDEIYAFDETVKPDFKAQDYAVKTQLVTMGGRPAKWVFMHKGEVHAFELVQEGRKKVMKLQKVLEFGYDVESVEVHNDKSMIFTVSSSGIVSAYVCDIAEMNKYTLTIMDKVSLAQVAADIKTGKNIQPPVVEQIPQEARIRIAPSHTINQMYFAVCNRLQFVYFRNYMKRVTLYKIALSGLPMSVAAYETKKQSEVLVGLADGSIEVINAMEPDQRYKLDSVVNASVEDISTVRSKQTVLITQANALALYSL